MKEVYMLIICALFCTSQAGAQSVLTFSVKQPPPLLIDAGADVRIEKGEKVRLGGALPVSGGAGPYTYIWSPSKGLDRADIPNPTASPDSTTTYTLTVSDQAGCSQATAVTVTVNEVTGLEDLADQFGLTVVPNPNRGRFLVSTTREVGKGLVLLEVFDPVGRLVYRETVKGYNAMKERIVVLPSSRQGLYILRLTGDRIAISRKILVQ
ncbi:hypothetical protein ABID22_000874 [Pontibacter aydingkolensis]|uniref:T9SS type A sorting domain-containing protein n=1 Tax=Pontibacter aydingkolensis TaxID=1911536 RepID=A0ABS7CSP9_9BACT|nr:T9SS type A sorting domain-containing protein [Pontibacter aydingkolensis]MBW7466874.1 T9SS type A sorting domain-containing protein [Pontibacter aydingkolensis]